MKPALRPRRSVLYMPGSNVRALEKARTLPADCLILDLEDAVAPAAKATARAQVAAAIQAGGYGQRELVVRVNPLESEWGRADIKALAKCGADAILLPKVESATTVTTTLELLDTAGGPADLALWIMAETPRGILALDSIVAGQKRLQTIVMGTSDLAKELRLGTDATRTGLLHALGHSVLTARAHGLDIIDGVHLALDDTDGLRNACLQGRALGFDGKSLIHPRQIPVANDCFGISEAEAASAREIVAAWQQTDREKDGVTVLHGQLIEELHVNAAERVLAIFAATKNLTGQD